MPDSEIMDVSKIDVAHVAHLARIHLSGDEIRIFQSQLDQIVGYVRKISELNLAGIEPTSHAKLVRNVFRADEVRPSLDRDVVLKNAPKHTNGQFIVPKIIE